MNCEWTKTERMKRKKKEEKGKKEGRNE